MVASSILRYTTDNNFIGYWGAHSSEEILFSASSDGVILHEKKNNTFHYSKRTSFSKFKYRSSELETFGLYVLYAYTEHICKD